MGSRWRRLLFLLRKRRFDRDLDEEMRLHRELRARKLAQSGLDDTEAAYAARRRFGNSARLAEQSRDVWGWTWLESWIRDTRFAARILWRNPVFTAAAVLTLALGIGANAAIFTMLNAMLFKRLPVPEPERLLQVVARGDELVSTFCFPAFEEIQRTSRTLDGLFTWNATNLSMGYGVDARRIEAAVASGAVYRTLGIQAQLGRLFTPEDDRANAPPVAVISHRFWESEFQRDPRVAGRTLLLDRQRFTIVGVTPRSFRGVFLGADPQVTIPIHANAQLHPKWDILHTKDSWWLSVIGRMRPGVTAEQVHAEMRTLSPSIFAVINPGGSAEEQRQLLAQKLDIVPASAGVVFLTERFRKPMLLLIALAGLVLLIACVNLANLLLARAAAREREMSLRLALGASRGRLARQVITECFLLLAAGTAMGTLAALSATRAAARLLPMSLDLQPDLRMVAFLVAMAVLAGLVFSAVPAIRGTGLEAHDVVKQSRIGTGRGRSRLGDAMVAAQIAMSMILLIGALLFVRTFSNLRSQNPGFDGSNLVFAELNSERSGMKPEQLARFYEDLLQDLRALPFVRAASLTGMVPISGNTAWDDLPAEQWPNLNRQQRTLFFHRVAADYFKTMGTPILRGRDFRPNESASATESPAILNEAAAQTYFPAQEAVGQLLRHGEKQTHRVIGVVGNARYQDLREEPPRTIYLEAIRSRGLDASPIMSGSSWNLIVRADRDTRPVVAALRSLVRATGKDVVLVEATPYDALIDSVLLTERLVAILATSFALLASLLAAIGLYGVMAYSTARRTSEIGVRIALGASRPDVLRMVLRRAIWAALAGSAAGIPAALLCGRLISSMLYGVKTTDLATIAAAAAFMLAISALAGFLPAWRASRLDPMTALRWE